MLQDLAKTLGALAAFAMALGCTPAARAQPAAQAHAAPAAVQAPAPPPAPVPAAAPGAPDYVQAGQILAQLQNQLPSVTNDAQLAAMGRRAAAIQGAADGVVAAREAQLAAVQVQIRQPIPLRPRRLREAAEQKRAAAKAQAGALDAQLVQPRALAAQASQTFAQIAERRRQGFSARVLTPTASPLSPDFWTSLADAAGADLQRMEGMVVITVDTAMAAPEPRGLAGLAIGALVAFILLVPARLRLERMAWRLAHRLGLGGAARTLAVIWTAGLAFGAAALGASALRLGAKWGGLLAPSADLMARAAVGAVAWAAAILALGRALATDSQSERRLLKISDAEAARACAVLWIVALVTAAGALLQRLNFILGASLAATIASNCAISLAYAVAAALMLISFSGAPAAATPAQPARPRPPAWTLIALVLAAAIIATLGAVLLGYTTLAALISGQIFWLSLIAAVAFLLLRLIDDIGAAVSHPQSRPARALSRVFGLRPSTVVQIGLLVSAAVQLLVIFAAVTLALTPFGQSGELLVAHIRQLGGSVRIGKATISPVALAAGVATFAFGMSLSHLARSWVVRRYLPVTDWDAGVRNSVSTGVAYLGVAIAVACGLAVTGLSFQQIALIASALSVGIGFGLQQIVQNFVAGVILLIERPVKVGDSINVSGVEGDVARIRVRATEIRAPDSSTVIVPNSSLITMNVQNRSLTWPQAHVRLQISIRNPVDARKAREAMLRLACAKPIVLEDPAPRVMIDALADSGAANLSLWLCLADPRDGAKVKSELYFEIIEAFETEKIAIGTGA